MEAVSTSTVTTVKDTSFEILMDVFVSRNRSKGASIDDQGARESERKRKKERECRDQARTKEEKEKERASTSRCSRRGMAGFFEEEGLFVEQTENASEASAEPGKSAAAATAAAGGGEKREEGDERRSPSCSTKGSARPLFIFRPQHNILSRKAARGRRDRRAAAPFRNRILTVADESILRVFASLRANFSRAHLYLKEERACTSSGDALTWFSRRPSLRFCSFLH